jgi:hypothetical protein
VLGDGGVVDAGREEDGDFFRGGMGDVDVVEADAVFADDAQARERLVDDGGGDGVVAAEEGVELPGEFEHSRLGKRAALADDFNAELGEHVVVRAGRVLE